MATAERTIYYAFDTDVTTLADAVTANLAQITVEIPEASPTFTSVTADIAFQDAITATGGTINEHRVGIRLGAAAYTTVTETDDIANTGENLGGVISPFDFTSHFNTNWTGTSMTCDMQVYFDQNTGTTLGMRNVNGLLTITYTYDDDPATNPTQMKTAIIPLESLAGALTTTANSNIGSNQIPNLSTFLPETNVVIKDYFFVIEGNVQNNNTTTDFTVSANIDAGTAKVFATTEAALASDYFTRLIWKPSSVPSTASTHNFQLWSSVANKMNHVAIDLYVTYAYDPDPLDDENISIQLPIEIASPLGVTSSAEASRFYRTFIISDPGTITLQQSAFRINFNAGAAVAGLNFRAGAQSFRAYTNLGNGVCGMFSLQQRLDSGSALGAGVTLARGSNTITIDGYATDTTDQVTNINGVINLNYKCQQSASPSQNNHTVRKILSQWNALLQDRVRTNNYAFSIPPANYWLTGQGFLYTIWQATASNAITFDVECLSGEGKDAGYYDIYTDAVQTDAERGCSLVYMRGRDVFKRYPQDPDTERLDIETARDYRLFNAATAGTGMMALATYHSNTFTTTLTIEGSAGGTVDIDIFRADTDEKILTTSRVGNGTVDVTWYNDLIDVYAVARESDALLMRSANFNFGD